MIRIDLLSHETVKAAIEALQDGDRARWSAQFETGAELVDDGNARSLAQFTTDAVGHECFRSIDHVAGGGLEVTGEFHSDQWGTSAPTFVFTCPRRERSTASTSARPSERPSSGPARGAPVVPPMTHRRKAAVSRLSPGSPDRILTASTFVGETGHGS